MPSDPNQIIAVVSGIYGISPTILVSPVKSKSVVHARGVAVHLIRVNTHCSFKEIGKLFFRDHSSVIRCEERLLEDASSCGDIAYAQAQLEVMQ